MCKTDDINFSFNEAHHSPRASRDMPRDNLHEEYLIATRAVVVKGIELHHAKALTPGREIHAGNRANKNVKKPPLGLSLARESAKLMSNEAP
jgi:hypothetical protein